MADTVTAVKRSEVMRAVRSKDSAMEVRFRKALWSRGYRFRKNAANYLGKPDLALRKHKTVIFLDSCFWHGCEDHCRMPSTKQEYWAAKIQRNRRRDAEVNAYYHSNGWCVLRIWEHEISASCDDVVARTTRILTCMGTARHSPACSCSDAVDLALPNPQPPGLDRLPYGHNA